MRLQGACFCRPSQPQTLSLPPISHLCYPAAPQFLAWDTYARRRIDFVGREDEGDKVIAHEFDATVVRNLIYNR